MILPQIVASPSSLRPRGTKVMLPHGGLPEIFPPYLSDLIAKTGGPDGPIGRQFVARPELEKQYYHVGMKDPLMEDEHEVAPGLVYKYQSNINGVKKFIYQGRALWTITRHCAAYCRFCTRGREVGITAGQVGNSRAALSHTPHLLMDQIDETLAFIEKEPGLNEIVLSGGDPLTVNPKILHYVLEKLGGLQRIGKLRIVRIGTRVPIHNPLMIREDHYEAIANLRNPRMMIHINHPLELTAQTLRVLERLRRNCGGIVMSQTVLLAGVNDSVETLYTLFSTLAAEGIVPYYVFQNDAVYWAKHFTVPLPKAIKMWQKLRPMLSGVAATARFVIDVARGYGKIPLPEGDAWRVDYSKGFKDFHGNHFFLDYADK
ncbi:radical SAM protein [Candidatus Gottesmanbacteria bacterium]|nr:radical SAM protein [Candidatus Gottesmanbacteria bacterium]